MESVRLERLNLTRRVAVVALAALVGVLVLLLLALGAAVLVVPEVHAAGYRRRTEEGGRRQTRIGVDVRTALVCVLPRLAQGPIYTRRKGNARPRRSAREG